MNVQCKRCGLGKTRLRYPTRTIRRRVRTYVRSVNHVTTKGKEVDHNLWVWGSVPRARSARGSPANKCLHILRTLRKELFRQKEIDHLFKTLVLPILTYALAVYGASDSDLNVIQRFFCHKRLFTSQTVSIFNLLEQQDKSAFKRAINNHMLGTIIPKDKELVYNLRRSRCHLPQIKTERYKKTFVNRLIFKYNLV